MYQNPAGGHLKMLRGCLSCKTLKLVATTSKRLRYSVDCGQLRYCKAGP